MKTTLCVPNPSPEAVRVYEYLLSVRGKGILAGQQENPMPRHHASEMRYIKKETGKLPAIRGLDYIHLDFEGVNRRAKNWWKQGGIVTICYHWGTPPDGVGYPSSKETIDMAQALTEGTALHEGLLRQMDEAALALRKLRDAHVPVLWRPFHEFDGQWFWWGKGGAELFKKLWRLMYERYTHHWGLNNLIWVLGYCGEPHEGWYPGDEYVDIVGADAYSEGIRETMYRRMQALHGDDMLICYHENGPIPDPEVLQHSDVNWSWFMTWHTIHIRQQNTKDYLRKVYLHDYTVTLDKLPRFI